MTERILLPKRAANGGLIYEAVTGKDGRELERALAGKLSELFDLSGTD